MVTVMDLRELHACIGPCAQCDRDRGPVVSADPDSDAQPECCDPAFGCDKCTPVVDEDSLAPEEARCDCGQPGCTAWVTKEEAGNGDDVHPDDRVVSVRLTASGLSRLIGWSVEGYRVWFTAGEPDAEGYSFLTFHYDPEDRLGCDACRLAPIVDDDDGEQT